MLNILLTVLIFAAIIFIHEFGHFITAKLCGIKVKDLNFPAGAIISSIDRNGEVIIPTGDDIILAGDRITIFVGSKSVRKIERLINV